MKKFYALALAVAVAISASAHTPVAISEVKMLDRPTAELKEAHDAFFKIAQTPRLAPSRIAAEAVSDFYYWLSLNPNDMKQQAKFVQVGMLSDASGNADPNTLGILGMAGNLIIAGDYDAAASTLSVKSQELGSVTVSINNTPTPVDVTAEVYKITEDGTAFNPTDDAFVITFNENGATTDEMYIFAVNAYLKNATGDYAGSFFMGMGNELLKDTYSDLGEGTFVDGIMPIILLGKGDAANPTQAVTSNVLIQRSDLFPETIRIYDAWHAAFQLVDPDFSVVYNFDFDISNPDCVLVPYQECGVSTKIKDDPSQSDWSIELVSISYSAFQTIDAFLASQYASQNVTLSGDVITIAPGAIVFATEYDNSLFFTNNIESKVTLPKGWNDTNAVENVEVSNNAPVEYFNLQGIRVANPENGLYIKRQGKKVTKVLVK